MDDNRIKVPAETILERIKDSPMSFYREEVRCSIDTALMIKVKEPVISHRAGLQVALGVPVVVNNSVPNGVMQLWQDGTMVREFTIS